MDLDILAALSQRAAFDSYSRFVTASSLSEEAWTIFSAMGEWLKANQAPAIDWPAFGAWFVLVRSAKLDKGKLRVCKDLITKLTTREASGEAGALIHGLARRDYAAKIGDLALRISDGEKGEFSEIEHLLAEYARFTGQIDQLESHFSPFNVEALRTAAAPGLGWRHRALQAGAGDLRRGDLVAFVKRPNTGGTTFVASEATWMAEGLEEDDAQVLWINNEQRGELVTSRIMQACLQWKTDRMLAEPEKAHSEYLARMGREDRILVVDWTGIRGKDVERILDKMKNPKLIVLDQAWKMKGFDSKKGGGEESADRQTAIANWERETAKTYAPVLGVYQADFTAEGQRWINQSQIYYSKTGIQGEADLIITMGRDFKTGDSRYVWLPKNKMLTPGDRSKMEGKWEWTLIKDEARFEEHGV